MCSPRNLLRTALPTLLACTSQVAAEAVRITHLHNLSDFSGTVPYNDVRLHVDRQRGEIYAVAGNRVRIFNESGMEVFSFDHDPTLATIYDLAVESSGEILLLTYRAGAGDPAHRWSILRCDYRGRAIETVSVSGLPGSLDSFAPNLLFPLDERVVLVSRSRLDVVELDRSGRFLDHRDLAALIGLPEERRDAVEIFGFNIDTAGNMLFTIPVQFRAYVIAADGTVRAWGRSGSAPGTFGVASGIAADDLGHYVVTDTARNVVMVFDADFRLVTEFGFRGNGAADLIRPTELAVGNGGKVYVTQARKRGVSVFSITHKQPTIPGEPSRATGGEPAAVETMNPDSFRNADELSVVRGEPR